MTKVDRLIGRFQQIVLTADYPPGHVVGADGLALNDLSEAAAALTDLQAQVAGLREALTPFAFLEMEKEEGMADTQYVWETIHSDRVRDWFDFDNIETARAELEKSNG